MRLADFYVLLGKPDEAKRILTEITTKAPDDLPAWRLLAEINFTQGQLDAAGKAVGVILKKDPSDIDGRLLRGRVHLAKCETKEALQDFQSVIKRIFVT